MFAESEAELHLPEGLSLAPTGHPQSTRVSVPDIAPGSSESVFWALRGALRANTSCALTYTAVIDPTESR